jgi:hypothetical protein
MDILEDAAVISAECLSGVNFTHDSNLAVHIPTSIDGEKGELGATRVTKAAARHIFFRSRRKRPL